MFNLRTRMDSRAFLCEEFLYFIENIPAYNSRMRVLYENLLQLTMIDFLLPWQIDCCVFLLNK